MQAQLGSGCYFYVNYNNPCETQICWKLWVCTIGENKEFQGGGLVTLHSHIEYVDEKVVSCLEGRYMVGMQVFGLRVALVKIDSSSVRALWLPDLTYSFLGIVYCSWKETLQYLGFGLLLHMNTLFTSYYKGMQT